MITKKQTDEIYFLINEMDQLKDQENSLRQKMLDMIVPEIEHIGEIPDWIYEKLFGRTFFRLYYRYSWDSLPRWSWDFEEWIDAEDAAIISHKKEGDASHSYLFYDCSLHELYDVCKKLIKSQENNAEKNDEE